MRDDDIGNIDDTVVRRPRVANDTGAAAGADALGDTVIRPLPPIPQMPQQTPPDGPDAVTPAGEHEWLSGDTVIRPGLGGRRAAQDADPLGDTVLRPGTSAVPGTSGVPGTSAVLRAPGGAGDHADSPESGEREGTADPDDPDDPEATIVRARAIAPGPVVPPVADRRGGVEPRLPSGPPSVTAPTRRVPSVRVAGRVVRLDQPVVIGRRPALPRVLRGPAPVLVTVPSPSGQVSSSHVMVQAEGEVAVVEDLRSTNGTVIRPAGAAPFRMRSGASNVVLTGTVVEIGDGNVIEVLSPHLRVAPASDDLDPFPTLPPGPPTGTPPHPRERP